MADIYFAKESEIQKESLKFELSDDYFEMLQDNRKYSTLYVDIPDFSTSVPPTMFSNLFFESDFLDATDLMDYLKGEGILIRWYIIVEFNVKGIMHGIFQIFV